MTEWGQARFWLAALLAALLLHNAEEALALTFMPGELAKSAAVLGYDGELPSPGRVYLGLALFTVIPAALLLLAIRRPSPVNTFMACAIATMMAVNALIPHLTLALLTGGYGPGLITAMLCTLPAGLGVTITAWRRQWLPHRALTMACSLGVVLLPLALSGFWALSQTVLTPAR